MNGNGLRVYVGCALTEAPPEFVREVTELKEALRRDFGLDVLDFLGGPDSRPDFTPIEVWNWDINHCVEEAQAMLGILDYPSTGLGIELERAGKTRGIPLLLTAKEGRRVSRLPRGMPYPNAEILTYQLIADVPRMFMGFLARRGVLGSLALA